MESRIYDSFSESKEGSYHGSARVDSPEAGKGGLSQLLADAAHTLQGGLPHMCTAKSSNSLDASDAGHEQDNATAAERTEFSPASRRTELSASLGKQANSALTAWQRFFSHHNSHGDRAELRDGNHTSHPKEPAKVDVGHTEEGVSDGRLPQQHASSLVSHAKGKAKKARQHRGREASPSAAGLRNSEKGGSSERHDNVTEQNSIPSSPSPATGPQLLRGPTVSPAASSETADLPRSMSHMARSSMSRPSSSATGGRNSTDDSRVPSRVYYESVSTSGQRPSCRWGHASAVWQDRLFLIGGASSSSHWQSESYIYRSGNSTWTRVPASAKCQPPATFGAAACTAREKIFLFGGKQDQKHCRKLYTLDPSSKLWKAHKESASAPPACCSHTMTAVGQYGIYTFGGEGRRLSNWVYSLDPDTYVWRRVNTLGVPPPPRQGHTAVWDGADSLIIFGGNSGDKIFADIRLLSLSTGYWSEAKCSGSIPPPRHSHTAAKVDANLMLVWGGCGHKGAVLNDAYLLNTTSFRWHKLESIGSPPSGRYGHSCCVVGKQVLLFGGTSAVQFFESLISISLDVGNQLNSLAESLANLSHHSEASSREEMVKMQLGNHLRERHARDVSEVALTRAEISHRLFEDERKRSRSLQAEVEQLKLVISELESKSKRESEAHAAALQAAHTARAAEKFRTEELHSQLQEALERIQQQDGGAAVVDGYKNMFKRMVAERDGLADRNIDLEYQHKLLKAELQSLRVEAAPDSCQIGTEAADAWEEEFDMQSQRPGLDQLRSH